MQNKAKIKEDSEDPKRSEGAANCKAKGHSELLPFFRFKLKEEKRKVCIDKVNGGRRSGEVVFDGLEGVVFNNDGP